MNHFWIAVHIGPQDARFKLLRSSRTQIRELLKGRKQGDVVFCWKAEDQVVVGDAATALAAVCGGSR